MIVQDGKVAIKYFQPLDQTIQVGKDVYFFSVRRNVSMAWVKEEHYQQVLDFVKVCCGGNRTHPFRLANESDVRIWSGISER